MLAVVTCNTQWVVHVNMGVDTQPACNFTGDTVRLYALYAETLCVLAVPIWLAAVKVIFLPVVCIYLDNHLLECCRKCLVVCVCLQSVNVCEALLELCACLVAEEVGKNRLALCEILVGEHAVECVQLVPVGLQLRFAYCNFLDCPMCRVCTGVPTYNTSTLRCCIVHTVAVVGAVCRVECVVVAACVQTVQDS